jgi:hypothetical protein
MTWGGPGCPSPSDLEYYRIKVFLVVTRFPYSSAVMTLKTVLGVKLMSERERELMY